MRLPGFYKLSPADRLDAVATAAGLGAAERAAWSPNALSLATADAMIENVVGTFAFPNAVAVNLVLNGRERLVPMVVEEPSVVAAVSNMARLAPLTAEADPGVMIGQIQLSECDAEAVRARLPELTALAGTVHPELARFGGGLRGMEVREIVYDEPGFPREEMVVLHFFLDCADAMGANMVNTVAERLAAELSHVGRVGLRILSNLADRRCARARVAIPVAAIGEEVAHGIASAYRFAWADPYRAATHNKGIMNGVDAVALATGNDWRAIEAGAHAYAARDGQYRPLSTWRVVGSELVGTLEMPVQVGVVSGAIRVHPTVQANLKVAGVTSAADLAMLMVAVGLVQNLGALRALATEGIQRGHMRMHARTVAIAAGAQAEELAATVEALVDAGEFTLGRARKALRDVRNR